MFYELEKIVNEVFDDYTFPKVRTIGYINGYNCYEEDGNMVIEVNAAGIKKKDIDVSLLDDRLTIKANDKLRKTISLPKNADIDHISAKSNDGLLKLTIPLKTTKRSIKVK